MMLWTSLMLPSTQKNRLACDMSIAQRCWKLLQQLSCTITRADLHPAVVTGLASVLMTESSSSQNAYPRCLGACAATGEQAEDGHPRVPCAGLPPGRRYHPELH